jgi:hypothetical protein
VSPELLEFESKMEQALRDNPDWAALGKWDLGRIARDRRIQFDNACTYMQGDLAEKLGAEVAVLAMLEARVSREPSF